MALSTEIKDKTFELYLEELQYRWGKDYPDMQAMPVTWWIGEIEKHLGRLKVAFDAYQEGQAKRLTIFQGEKPEGDESLAELRARTFWLELVVRSQYRLAAACFGLAEASAPEF